MRSVVCIYYLPSHYLGSTALKKYKEQSPSGKNYGKTEAIKAKIKARE